MSGEVLLDARGVKVAAQTKDGSRTLLHGVDFEVRAGEMSGIVGETGSGKSMSLRAAMGLLPGGVRLTGGTIHLGDVSLLDLDRRELRRLRGSRIGFVPQQPLEALHPIISLDRQFYDVMRSHERIKRAAARERAREMLQHVGIMDPDRVLASRAFELSGGMAQRTAIAMVLTLRPSVLLADEPTSALDVTIQRDVLHLLRRLCAEDGLGILLVTHDLGVVAHVCQDVTVFKDGRVVERGATRDILDRPDHEYTRLLVGTSTRSQLASEPMGSP